MANAYDFQSPEDMGDPAPFYGLPEPQEPEAVLRLVEMAEKANVADDLKDEQLTSIGVRAAEEYRIDKESRKDWEEQARKAMEMAKQKKKDKTSPWPGASNVAYPMLTTAALQFAARAYPAIVEGPRIVKAKVLGYDEGGMKAAAGNRISQHMSFQLLHEVPNWETDMDTMLHQLPVVGCVFKKVYPNSDEAGFGNDLVSAFDFVVNSKTKDLLRVPRSSQRFELYPHEIQDRQRDGRFRNIDLKYHDDGEDTDAPQVFIEQHRYWDLDGDGMVEPWIVTFHEATETVMRITAGYDIERIQHNGEKVTKLPRRQYFVKYSFIPDPEGGFYDVGFGHLLNSLSHVIDTVINQMLDAGTLQNAGGGFYSQSVNISKGKGEIHVRPGRYTGVQAPGGALRDAFVSYDHPGPSQVLFNLLGMLLEAAKDVAAIQDVLIGDTPANQTATTTMATIEQGLKVFTAIYKRVFRSLCEEYKLIFDINRQGLDQVKYVNLLDEPVQVTQADYIDDLQVRPVADPNTVTDMQRMARAQVVLDEAKAGNPTVDIAAATHRAFEAAKIEDVEKIIVKDKEPSPMEQIQMATAEAELKLKQVEIAKAERELAKIEAEIGKMGADTDKTLVDTDKSAMEAQEKRAMLGVPANAPAPVPAPLIEGGLEFEPVPDAMPFDVPPEQPMDIPPEAIDSMMDQVPPMADQMMPPQGSVNETQI
jgi:chaperonin GroES